MGDLPKAEVVKVLSPVSQSAPYPLLLALQGDGNVDADRWTSAVSHGWLVCPPQSSEDYVPEPFTLNHWDCEQQEVLERYTALIQDYSVDPDRVVLAGFSQGAGLAAWLVLSGQIRAAGLVLVAPFLCDVNKIHALIDAHRPKGLKVFLVVGHRDCHCLEVARQLVDLLPRHGVMCQLIEYQDLEHKFPVDFEKKLPEALDFVSQTW